MKRIVHPNTPQADIDKFLAKKHEQEQGVVVDKPISEISLDGLLGDGLLGLYREMKNLLFLSTKGKLSPADSKDLRDTVKLLFELKDREKELLEGLQDEDIVKKLESIPNVDEKRS